MSDEIQLMGVGEAVACLGVTWQRLHVLRRQPDFPQPVAVLACGTIWLAEDIKRYAATRNRTPGRPRKRT